jgi:hypothetical protein
MQMAMAGELTGKRIAVVATDGFEQSELIEPRNALRQPARRLKSCRRSGAAFRA